MGSEMCVRDGSQATHWAACAALGAQVTGRACKVWLDRDRDMVQTGNRHPFWTRYEAAFDDSGRIIALRAHIYSDGGFSIDLSCVVLDRAAVSYTHLSPPTHTEC